jgi:NAD(P)-dependent dehydrogenase (short-subunit alcohol dehydrogenase family)
VSRLVAIFGGRSEIGLAVATRLADGARVVLAARPGPLDDAVAACQAAGAVQVETVEFDADEVSGPVSYTHLTLPTN